MKTRTINHILEIRVRGDRKKKLLKFCNYYSHAKNLLYILIQRNFDFFMSIGINEWNLNLLFTDKLYNRGNNNKKLELKKKYEYEILTDQYNKELVNQLKRFKNYVGNSIFQALVKEVVNNYKSYFGALVEYKKDPSKFESKPKPPKAKKLSKINNCSIQFNQLVFKYTETEKGKVIQLKVGNPYVKFKLPDWFNEKVSSVRVVRKLDDIYIHILYKIQIPVIKRKGYVAGIDTGLDNLLTIVSSNPNMKSVIINGRELKAFNQWYNKLKASLQSESKDIDRRKLERYRARRIKSIFHQITSKLVHLFIVLDITEVIIGKSAIESKDGINLGKKTNQNFVYIPFRQLIDQLKYKCKKYGIKVKEVDESYTSKCSALSDDYPEKKEQYSGKRIKRGLYKDTKLNKVWNADCNGALNIIKKVRKNILSSLSTKEWIDKLSRPIRIYLLDIIGLLYNLYLKVSCESFLDGKIAGSIEELNIVPPCHEVPCQF